MADEEDDTTLAPLDEDSRSWADFEQALFSKDSDRLLTITWDFDYQDRQMYFDDDVADKVRRCENVKSVSISGYLPFELGCAIGYMCGLKVLDMKNSFMKTIPREWSALSELTEVAFGTNYDITKLPECIKYWRNLVSLDMSKLHGLKSLPEKLVHFPLQFVRHNQYFAGLNFDARHEPGLNQPQILAATAKPLPTQTVAILSNDTHKKRVLLDALCSHGPPPVAQPEGGQYEHVYRTTQVLMGPWYHTRVAFQDFGVAPESDVNQSLCATMKTVYMVVLSSGDDTESVRLAVEEWATCARKRRTVFVVTAEPHEVENSQDVLEYARSLTINGLDISSRVVSAYVGGDGTDVTELLAAIAKTHAESTFRDSIWATRRAVYHTTLHRAQKSVLQHAISEEHFTSIVYSPANRRLREPMYEEFEVLQSMHDRRFVLWVRVADGPEGRLVFLRPWWVAKKLVYLRSRVLDRRRLQLRLEGFLLDGLRDCVGTEWKRDRSLLWHFFATLSRLEWQERPGVGPEVAFWTEFNREKPESFEGILEQD